MVSLLSVCTLGEMNGPYTLSNYSGGQHFVYGTGHRGSFIDVYSWNISTRYSEVYWTMQPAVPLPADFVARYAGRVVALTGMEYDAVRTAADGTETSVPITHQYNHHHKQKREPNPRDPLRSKT